MQRLQMCQEYLKDRAGNWADYERIRVQTAKRYLTRTDPIRSVEAAVEVLGSRNPLEAVNLRDLSVLLGLLRNLNLGASDDDEAYIRRLSTVEVGFDVSKIALRRLTLKL